MGLEQQKFKKKKTTTIETAESFRSLEEEHLDPVGFKEVYILNLHPESEN